MQANNNNTNTITKQQQIRKQLQQLVASYLASGKTIKVLPTGKASNILTLKI